MINISSILNNAEMINYVLKYYRKWFQNTFTKFGGGFLTPEQGKNVPTLMIANADQFHALHILPTSIFWIFVNGTT